MVNARLAEPASLTSLCCDRRASARVRYVPNRTSPSHKVYGALGSSVYAIGRDTLVRVDLLLPVHGRAFSHGLLARSCSSARRNQFRAASNNAARASSIEAARAVAQHSRARCRYCSAWFCVTGLVSFARPARSSENAFRELEARGHNFARNLVPAHSNDAPRH
jgi:hypothetical protein